MHPKKAPAQHKRQVKTTTHPAQPGWASKRHPQRRPASKPPLLKRQFKHTVCA